MKLEWLNNLKLGYFKTSAKTHLVISLICNLKGSFLHIFAIKKKKEAKRNKHVIADVFLHGLYGPWKVKEKIFNFRYNRKPDSRAKL